MHASKQATMQVREQETMVAKETRGKETRAGAAVALSIDYVVGCLLTLLFTLLVIKL
jgi:hypothetical protein